MIKISFIGDIMCEPMLLNAAKQRDGTYNFSGVFDNVRDSFKESDYVIGNLETPLAGKNAGYVRELFSFNAPDEFAKAIKEAGIDFVSTANNHCVDRGIKGLKRTLKVLDSNELKHDGTFEKCEEHVPFVTDVKGTKIALLSYTYGTNYGTHHKQLPDQRFVELLHSDTEPVYITDKISLGGKLKAILFKPLKLEQKAAIKKALGMEFNRARKDDFLDEKRAQPYFDSLEKKIRIAKEAADIVIFLPHIGGQFNTEPGKFTYYAINKAIDYGVDAVIASHPHIVQKADVINNIPCFFSIGNFSMSPNSVYLLHDNLPEYGLIVHLYIKDKRICKITFSILKIIEEKGRMLSVWPVDSLSYPCKRDIMIIYKTLTGQEITDPIVRHEYDYKVFSA